jgi:hypothetical protein
MPVAATRQCASLPAPRTCEQTDRPYPLIGGLSPGRPPRPLGAAAHRLGRLLDHEPLCICQAVDPVDKLVDLLLENLRRSGGAAPRKREKLTNAFRQRTMKIIGLVALRHRKSTKLRRPDAQITVVQTITAVDAQEVEAH